MVFGISHLSQDLPKNFNGNSASVIIVPKSEGCDAKFLDQLINFYPEKIIYVSCAPDTQARDLKILLQIHDVVEIQPFDMFPQTRTIENDVVLRKKKGYAIYINISLDIEKKYWKQVYNAYMQK